MLLIRNSGIAIGSWLFSIVFALVGFISGSAAEFAKTQRLSLSRMFRDARSVPIKAKQLWHARKTKQVRQSFFTTTFSIMGHVAKSDGQVKKSQIELANSVMERMNLNAELRAAAIGLFKKGKQSNFNLDKQVKRFRNDCASSTDLYRVFLEIQIQAALADGEMARQEEAILLHIAKVLGFSEVLYRQVESLERRSLGLAGARHRSGSSQSKYKLSPKQNAMASMRHAYAVLGVKPSDQKATVKSAYRKLMSQHHPDKLISKGLPEEMHKLATDKTQEIQKAYGQIKLAKCW